MNTNVEWFRFGYDLQILTDLDGPEDQMYPVYALGDKGDRSVGINGFEASLWFKSVEELEAWCSRNRAELERLLEALMAARPEFTWDDYMKAVEVLQ